MAGLAHNSDLCEDDREFCAKVNWDLLFRLTEQFDEALFAHDFIRMLEATRLIDTLARSSLGWSV